MLPIAYNLGGLYTVGTISFVVDAARVELAYGSCPRVALLSGVTYRALVARVRRSDP